MAMQMAKIKAEILPKVLLATNTLALLIFLIIVTKTTEKPAIHVAHVVFTVISFAISLLLTFSKIPKTQLEIMTIFFDGSMQYAMMAILLRGVSVAFLISISVLQLYNIVDIACRVFPAVARLSFTTPVRTVMDTYIPWVMAVLELLVPFELTFRFFKGAVGFPALLLRLMAMVYFYLSTYVRSSQTRVIFHNIHLRLSGLLMVTAAGKYYEKLSQTMISATRALSHLTHTRVN
ncbi:hypothetical protein J8273_7116 [Carpediemonas membranifera]|uniref:Uncharacterized protein n=1 Tax=Carpediemonas membranifera TaxID=201153 RepID=A0A8J6B184_9EUKA|nr:hypothetical protein J8273_7116 [Carpediemonas membranifera]|eukprot:KAG9390857.1 hypothetical protein J8273_7116 [Carpediemonas membranifera]